LEASGEYGSVTAAVLDFCVTPQPLLVPWASPTVAFKLCPLQVAPVLDITLQPAILAFGAPLEVMPCWPLPASATRQYE
jgi:hypothetical protein